MRTFMLAVTGLVIAVAACSSYGTSVVEVGKTRAQVASVSLTVPQSLAAGQTARATATPKDANGTPLTDRAVTWYTSSATIASVNDSGMISAVAPGTAVVSAVSEGISAQANMAVTPPTPTPIATLSVAISPPAVLIGQTAVATVTLQDSSGNPLSGRVVTWESSDVTVATVQSTGDVKAVGPGSAMIKASSEGKTNSSRLSVSAPAPIPVASVSVSPASSTLQVGGTVQLSAVTLDANNNVLTGRVIGWSSANTSIATVSSSGLVTAKAGGNVSITAASEGQIASAAITVSAPAPVPVASVSVTPTSSSLQIGGTAQLSAVTRDANNNVLTGRTVTWASANAGIASVSASGLVTAVSAGTTQVTATSEGKTSSAAIITVSAPAPIPVATVSVSPTLSSLQIGGTAQLSVVTRDANGNVLTGRIVTWSSAGGSIASVNTSGFVTAVGAGTTQITATSEGKSGTATINVSAPVPLPVATVTLSPASSSFQVGGAVQLSAALRDSLGNTLSGRIITWSSANPSIASVNSSGLVTGLAAGGPVTITATSETKIGTAAITVTAAGSGPVWRAHEPSGMTAVSDQPFTSVSDGWALQGAAQLQSDATGPLSPGSALVIPWNAGTSGGNGVGQAYRPFSGSATTLYVCMWLKFSSNWQGPFGDANKIMYPFVGGGGNKFILEGRGSGSGPLLVSIGLQGTITPGTVFTNSNLAFRRGQWDMVEVIMKGNSAGVADGRVDVYLNGVLAVSQPNIQWTSGASTWTDQLSLDPVWGTPNDKVTSNMDIRFDQVYLSRK